MLNINAPKNSFAYQIAVENKQLGWFYNDYLSHINLFDLIFNTKKQLEKYKDFYFDWELELFFFYQIVKMYQYDNSPFLVSNIPFILENANLVKDTLQSLNIKLEKKGKVYCLNLDNIKLNFDFFNIDLWDDFIESYDFWRYYYFYVNSHLKSNIQSVLVEDLQVSLVIKICKRNKNFFSNRTKRELKLVQMFAEKYYLHDLFFLDYMDINVMSEVIKLEKKYGNKVFALLSLLKKIPTETELKNWEMNLKLDLKKDLKIPVLKDKKLTLEYGWTVYELTTKQDLIDEAHYQRNCLKGYIKVLEQPNYSFFSCRKNKDRFTALFIDNKLEEVKGRFNKHLASFSQEIKEEMEYILLTLGDKLNDRK